MNPIKLSIEDVENQVSLQCALCKAQVKFLIIKEQYKDGYTWRFFVGSCICGGCAHHLFNEHEVDFQGKSSVMCKCGITLQNPNGN